MRSGISIEQMFFLAIKTLSSGVKIPTTILICEVCPKSSEKICDACRTRTRQTIDFKAKFNVLKRKPTIENGLMLPC